MGICLTSRKSSYSFEMGYGGFNNLRTNICKVFDKELGEVYADTLFALNDPQNYTKRVNEILKDERFKDEDKDILDFLFASDCGGKCSYKTAKKIYDLIKDIDFGGKIFTYAAKTDGKDYENFKEFLKECYQKHRTIIWY